MHYSNHWEAPHYFHIVFDSCLSVFFPSVQLILKDVDSIVYVDSDILFLQPVDQLWAFLSHFNSSQLAAMAPEHEEPRIAWYSRFARHPFYGTTGINSGVMLMNMTRMRSTFFKVGLKGEETVPAGGLVHQCTSFNWPQDVLLLLLLQSCIKDASAKWSTKRICTHLRLVWQLSILVCFDRMTWRLLGCVGRSCWCLYSRNINST